jgi:hypothetical protein
MADADPAPAAPPEANPDLASDAALAERAAALVAALRSADTDALTRAVVEVFAISARDESKQPADPRMAAALVAAGVGAALLPLIYRLSEIDISAAYALCELMQCFDVVRRVVVDNLGTDKLLELLHASNDDCRIVLAGILLELTCCAEWTESLSPDDGLVERAMSLPFLGTSSAYATKVVLVFVLALLKRRPASWRTLMPSRISLLVGFLSLCSVASRESRLLAATACELLQFLQTRDDFDFMVFDDAGVYVACVELLGDLCRRQADLDYAPQAEVTRVLMTASEKTLAIRQHVRFLLSTCPGALVSVTAGVYELCANQSADASSSVAFLDAMRRHVPAEWLLLDPSFAIVGIRIYRPDDDDGAPAEAYVKLAVELDGLRKTHRCRRALARPLQHQKLTAALSVVSSLYLGDDYKRLLVNDDRLEILVDALVDSAAQRFSEAVPAPDFSFWRGQALRHCTGWLVDDINLDATPVEDDDVAVGPAAKRARTVSAAALRASDVNVQRRDSTVLLIAGRPFYVNGALIETKSAVLADALSSATTLDPVAIALPHEIPEEQQYALFHAAIELAYTGTVASDVGDEALLLLWCLGDHLQMDELCTWCEQRLVLKLPDDAALLEHAWTTALARPSDALGDACARAWLRLENSLCADDNAAMLLLKRVHDGCAAKELVAAQLVRVLRKALLASLTGDAEAADERPI